MRYAIHFWSFACVAVGCVAIELGTAGNFAALSKATITNTGSTTLQGDVGTEGTSITGFPPGVFTGQQVINSGASNALIDAKLAYNTAATIGGAVVLSGNLGGRVLGPGTYQFTSSGQLTGTLILAGTGSPDDIWVFQIGRTLITSVGSEVILTGGGQPCHVFWQVGSSATLGGGSDFVGVLLAAISITANEGASADGGLYALGGSITLSTNSVFAKSCPAVPDTATVSTVLSSSTIVASSSTSALLSSSSVEIPSPPSSTQFVASTTTTMSSLQVLLDDSSSTQIASIMQSQTSSNPNTTTSLSSSAPLHSSSFILISSSVPPPGPESSSTAQFSSLILSSSSSLSNSSRNVSATPSSYSILVSSSSSVRQTFNLQSTTSSHSTSNRATTSRLPSSVNSLGGICISTRFTTMGICSTTITRLNNSTKTFTSTLTILSTRYLVSTSHVTETSTKVVTSTCHITQTTTSTVTKTKEMCKRTVEARAALEAVEEAAVKERELKNDWGKL